MRFVDSRRTFLAATLLLTPLAKVRAEERVLELSIHGAETSAKPQVLRVHENDQVVLRLTSDRPLHVHLHGYDIERDVGPNHPASLRFTATATGRFPLEIHSKQPGRQRPLAYLEVRPR